MNFSREYIDALPDSIKRKAIHAALTHFIPDKSQIDAGLRLWQDVSTSENVDSPLVDYVALVRTSMGFDNNQTRKLRLLIYRNLVDHENLAKEPGGSVITVYPTGKPPEMEFT